ncbi:MAG TPA: GH3 auxin-responsive promoter family protein [Candidatus Angelobacter sp.]
MICTVVNSLWLAGCLTEAARFRDAVKRVESEQQALLKRLLTANAATEFGRAHGFSSIQSVREYQERVPLRDYEGFRELVDRISAGQPNVLTREPIRLLEPTGGSAGAAKLVPYTASLQREFQRAIRSWIADLFLHDPKLLSGQAYWSVSPATMADARTPSGIAIGFEDDSAYVGGWQRRLVQSAMAVPGALRGIRDMKAFQYLTLLYLVRSSRLKLISVWNPTFLSLLVDHLPEWGDELAHDLEHGTSRFAAALPEHLRRMLRPQERRAAELRSALRLASAAERHASLWPELRLISCWTQANAATPAAHLKTLFPQASMQGKGLIATEGFVSFPVSGHADAALAVRSHFLEFLPADSSGEVGDTPQLAHELERGQRYAVVLTTGGGLYRYLLEDLVEVTGHLDECPLVRFVGRLGKVSDWFGEKLNEAHVTEALQDAFRALAITPDFAMLACDTRRPASYVLYIDAAEPDEVLTRSAARIDACLRSNFHYHYARELGQIAAVRVFRARAAAETYLLTAVEKGQRAGNVKPPALDKRDGWSSIFQGRFLSNNRPQPE